MVIFPETQPDTLPHAPGLTPERREDGTLALSYHAGQMSAEDVLAAVREQGIRIRDVRTEQADLQDVFLSLTRSRPAA
jgi:ABC-2 type transport system ATP-binding protein